MSPSPTDASRAFLGVGWAFPLALGAGGAVATAAYEEDVRQAILIILGTRRGERLMRPDFGAGLEDFVFEPMNVATQESMKKRVTDALNAWEPRIDVLAVSVGSDDPRLGCLLVGVQYRVRATNSTFNLVYPFYLEAGASS
jgi:phage baseplate assembly protein W